MKKLFSFWLPPFLWALLIFGFSSRPTGTATEIIWQDFILKKTAHVVIFGVLTVLLYRALKQNIAIKRKAAVWAIIFAALYGVSDEIHQSFTPGRDPTLRDVIFDTMGAILAIYGLWKLLPKAPKKLKKLAAEFQLT